MIWALTKNDVQVINVSLSFPDLTIFAASRGNEKAINDIEQSTLAFEKIMERVIKRADHDFNICAAAGNTNNKKFFEDSEEEYGYRTFGDRNKKSFHEYLGLGTQSGDVDSRYASVFTYTTNQAIKNRVIVVGAAGIDKDTLSQSQTHYRYADFSNIGERVDIASPGVDVYSTGGEGDNGTVGYCYMQGTSMATPMVTSATALVIAANPELAGPLAKKVIQASTYDYFYYTNGSCKMLDMNAAVEYALQTREKSVSEVIVSNDGALDLCFLVDTTNSMKDDIENAQNNMKEILSGLVTKTTDYRVALVDYRDFSDRAGKEDYPAKVQLSFTNNNSSINQAINSLKLGNGGDHPETVFSGIATTLNLDWRENAKKVIIILGDAEPLDPEPNTNYTYDNIVAMLKEANISIDEYNSDSRVLGDEDTSSISVYSIGVEASSYAKEFFESIADDTGGIYSEIESANEVSEAITDAINAIEVDKPSRFVNFGNDNAKEEVRLLNTNGEYVALLPLDEKGSVNVFDLEPNSYTWTIDRLQRQGTLELDDRENDANAKHTSRNWYDMPLRLYMQNTMMFWITLGCILLLVILLLLLCRLVKKIKFLINLKRTQRLATPTLTIGQTNLAYQTRYCRYCGKPISNRNGTFCPHCGKKNKG